MGVRFQSSGAPESATAARPPIPPDRGRRRVPSSGRSPDGHALRKASAGAALEPAALPLGEAAPDAEPLVVLECVLEALGPDLAAGADLLGLAGRAALLGEER